MKKLLAIILSFVIALSLAACHTESNVPDDTTVAGESTTTDYNGNEATTNTEGSNSTDSTTSSTEDTTSESTTTKPSGEKPNTTEPTHTHEYVDKVIAATCTTDGYTSHTCSCGDSYTDKKTNATGHNFGDWKTTKEPTTTSTGTSERVCSICSTKETKELGKIIENHKHSYTSAITMPATCKAEGVKTFSCSCGDTYSESIQKTAHKYTDKITKPSCTNNGYTTHTCSGCGDTYSDNITSPTGHTYAVTNTVNATCTANGYTQYTCSSCGHSYNTNVTDAKGHSYSFTSDTATCTSAGTKTETCGNCGNKKTSTSAAKGHSWGSWTTVIAADVGKAGQEKRTCSVCQNSETREIPALQEDFTKKWFVAQYDIAKQQYIHNLNKSITEKENKIADLRESASSLYVSYMQEVKNIKERYPNSATRDVMLQNAKDNYNRSAKIYTEKIDVLEEEIAAIEAEINNPNVDNILTIVTQNCNISSRETYEYYYKYADSLS